MKPKFLASLAMFAVLLAVCGSAFAHHGNAAYNMTAPVVLKNATVTEIQWINPHFIVKFDVKDDQGNVVHWAGEGGSPQALRNAGWTRNSVQVGDVVTAYVFQTKAGTPVGIVNKFIYPDGRILRDLALGGTAEDRADAAKEKEQQGQTK